MQSELDSQPSNLEIPKLIFKTFTPQQKYYYIYFIEQKKPNQLKISKVYQQLFGINYASDIQRFCYYPETSNIFTFIGFSTKEKMKKAMNEPSLLSAIIGKKISIYYEKINLKNESFISLNQIESYNINEISDNEPKYSLVLSLFIEKFKPEKDLFYCYFEEKNKPKGCISSAHFRDVEYDQKIINDVQRFYLLPNHRIIYTFLGFHTEDQLINAINDPKLQKLAKNNEIFVFYENYFINIKEAILNSHHNNNINEEILKHTQNLDHYIKTFIPQNDILYLYFVEKNDSNQKSKKKEKKKLTKEMINLKDIQRYCYYPGTHNAFSFFGFQSINDLAKNIDYLVQNLYSIDEIFIYNENIDQKTNKIKSLFLNNIKNIIKNHINNNNDDENESANFKDFVPKQNIIYVYFQDISNEICPFEAIADDVQLFCYYPGTRDLYSFYGFKSRKKVEKSVNDHLSMLREINNQIYIYFSHPHLYNNLKLSSYDYQEFKAKDDLIYFYFQEKDDFNSSKIDNCQDIQRNCFLQGIKEIYSFFGFNDKNILMNSIKSLKMKLSELFELKLYHTKRQSNESSTTMLIITQTSNEKMKFSKQNLNNDNQIIEEIQNQNDKDKTESTIVINITKTFEPITNLFYCFFKEKKQPTEKDFNKHCKKLYGIGYASDIQRFCFYPEQKDAFTFIGFSNKNKLESAMTDPSLLSSIIDEKIELYSNNEKEVIDDINMTDDNITLKKNEPKNNLVFSLFIEKFKPEKDLFYCFFEEKNKPKEFISSTHFRNVEYDQKIINDVQRFYLLHDQRVIYTFLGFLSESDMIATTTNPNFFTFAKNDKIFIYSDNLEESTKNEENHKIQKACEIDIDLFESFIPKNNVFYIYFIEKRGPTFEKLKARNRPIRQIINAYDVQRYSYYPKTKELFSFFGFASRKSLKRNIEDINLLSATLDGNIYFYGNNIDKITAVDKKDLFDLLTTSNIKINHHKSTNYINKSHHENDSSPEELLFNEFSPKENIIYIYLKEIQNPNSNKKSSFESISAFLKNSNDIQRLCYYPGTKDIYSFFGFLTEKPIVNLINNHSFLSKIQNNQVDLYYKTPIKSHCIKSNENDFNEFKAKKDLIYFYFEEEISKIPEKVSRSVNGITNYQDIQRYCYYPGTNNIYSFFGFSNKNDLIESIKKSTMKLKEILGLKLFNPNNQEISTMLIVTKTSNEKMKFSNENPIIDYESIIDIQNKNISDKTLQEKTIDPLKLPKCVKYDNDDIQFKTFEPQDNLIYFFFAEKIIPNKMILEKVKKIYQLNSASDIQRFCYYPGTNNIYTFIGFSNEILLNTAKKKSSLKSAAIDQSIFSYPYDISYPNDISNHYDINNAYDMDFACDIKDESKKYEKIRYKREETKIVLGQSFINYQNDLSANDDYTQLKETTFNVKATEFIPLTNHNIKPKSNIRKINDNSSDNKKENKHFQYLINSNESNSNTRINMQFRYKPNSENLTKTKIEPIQKPEINSAVTNLTNKEKEKKPIINNQFIYRPNLNQTHTEYSFNYKTETAQELDNNSASVNFTYKEKEKMPKINTQFRYTPDLTQNKTGKKLEFNSTFIQSNDNLVDNNNKKEEISEINNRFQYRPAKSQNTNNSENKNNQSEMEEINEIQFPKFNKYDKNDLKFTEFVPKDNLYYLFFAELTEPNYKIINHRYTTLFGIKYASDIQRFCYYPKTKNIYTFIGFSNQSQRNQGFSMSAIKAGSINQSIYFYPYKELKLKL